MRAEVNCGMLPGFSASLSAPQPVCKAGRLPGDSGNELKAGSHRKQMTVCCFKNMFAFVFSNTPRLVSFVNLLNPGGWFPSEEEKA